MFILIIAQALAGCSSAPSRPLEHRTVVIDPGHGGAHSGGVGPSGVQEKTITLEVALALRRLLVELGASVVLTRSHDQHLSPDSDTDLIERTVICNRIDPDLFLSLHTNISQHVSERGFEVWVRRNGAHIKESWKFAELICTELATVLGDSNRGIKNEHNLRVLKGTECPAVLVELEFLSNPEAEKRLANSQVQSRLADALAEAIKKQLPKSQAVKEVP
jgi:N-acetylmuramoyl-L-alanine amidase